MLKRLLTLLDRPARYRVELVRIARDENNVETVAVRWEPTLFRTLADARKFQARLRRDNQWFDKHSYPVVLLIDLRTGKEL